MLGRGCGISVSMHLQRERAALCRRARTKRRESICVKQAMIAGYQQAVTELGAKKMLRVGLKYGTQHCIPRDPIVSYGIGRPKGATDSRLKIYVCVCVFECTWLSDYQSLGKLLESSLQKSTTCVSGLML